jgi:hypothetical protein
MSLTKLQSIIARRNILHLLDRTLRPDVAEFPAPIQSPMQAVYDACDAMTYRDDPEESLLIEIAQTPLPLQKLMFQHNPDLFIPIRSQLEEMGVDTTVLNEVDHGE